MSKKQLEEYWGSALARTSEKTTLPIPPSTPPPPLKPYRLAIASGYGIASIITEAKFENITYAKIAFKIWILQMLAEYKMPFRPIYSVIGDYDEISDIT